MQQQDCLSRVVHFHPEAPCPILLTCFARLWNAALCRINCTAIRGAHRPTSSIESNRNNLNKYPETTQMNNQFLSVCRISFRCLRSFLSLTSNVKFKSQRNPLLKKRVFGRMSSQHFYFRLEALFLWKQKKKEENSGSPTHKGKRVIWKLRLSSFQRIYQQVYKGTFGPKSLVTGKQNPNQFLTKFCATPCTLPLKPKHVKQKNTFLCLLQMVNTTCWKSWTQRKPDNVFIHSLHLDHQTHFLDALRCAPMETEARKIQSSSKAIFSKPQDIWGWVKVEKQHFSNIVPTKQHRLWDFS